MAASISEAFRSREAVSRGGSASSTFHGWPRPFIMAL